MNLLARFSDMTMVHPIARESFLLLKEKLFEAYEDGVINTRFVPFETWRTFERQADLYKIGTTKAKPGYSAHQWGLAVDFVPFVENDEWPNGRWSWDPGHDYDFLKAMASKVQGLSVPISWDRVHVEHAYWKTVKKLLK